MLDLDNLIKKAMLDHKKVELKVYKDIKTEKQKLLTAKNAKPYDDVAEIKLLQKMIKEYEYSVQCYLDAGRDDVASEIQDELFILEDLVPAPPKQEEIDYFVKDLVLSFGEKIKMGEIIKATKANFPSADGKLISEIVKKYI